jgi:glycosyltransferase involved in cell wall biosynthesis
MQGKLIRICFVFPRFLPNVGGTEFTIADFSKELARRGYQITVLTTNAIQSKPSVLKKREKMDGATIVRLRFIPVPFYDSFFFSPSLVGDLLSVRANIIHIFSWIPSFFVFVPFVIAKIRRIPVVIHPQCYPQRFRYYPSRLRRFLGFFMDMVAGPTFLKRADRVIALTNTEANFYRQRGVENVEIIRIPFQLKKRPSQDQVEEFMDKADLNDGDRILLAVGRVEEYKGMHVLIEALPKIQRQVNNAKVLIVGKDWGFLSKCLEIARRLYISQSVVHVEYLTDEELSCAYEVADIVIVPSFFEGSSRVVIEAWAHHKPVVMTRAVGLAEIVSAKKGVVVEVGDSNALAEAVVEALSSPSLANSLGEMGYKLLTEEFSLRATTTKLEGIYDSLFSGT